MAQFCPIPSRKWWLKYFLEGCNLAHITRISPTELLTFTRKEKSWSIAGCFARVFRT
jgi:hypothetical protein